MSKEVKEPMATYTLNPSSAGFSAPDSLTKIFGSWLQGILPDLQKVHGRLEDDKTMMTVVKVTREGIPQKKYSTLKN